MREQVWVSTAVSKPSCQLLPVEQIAVRTMMCNTLYASGT